MDEISEPGPNVGSNGPICGHTVNINFYNMKTDL